MKETLLRIVQWVRNFIREKFHSQSEELPYYVTIVIALFLCMAGLKLFIELTDELAENELAKFDETISMFVMSWRREWLTSYFTFATHLGDRNAYVLFTILLAVFFRLKRRGWKFIFQATAVLMLATFSNIMLKKAINRARPSLEHLVSVNTLSYPSGHSMSAMAFYGFLAFLCLRYKMPVWIRNICVTVLVILILSIGISRIYLGVHFPSDVAAGFIGGLIWVTFCAVVFSLIDLLRRKRTLSASSR